jgi:hypothetical protein
MNVGMAEKHVFEHIKRIVHTWDVFFWMELRFKAIPHRFPSFHTEMSLVQPCTRHFLQHRYNPKKPLPLL